MSYDGFYLYSQVNDLKEKILNKRIEKIYQLNEKELIFLFRGAEKINLLISILPNAARMVILDEKPKVPENASIFSMFLRKHFLGSILKDIKQQGFERVLEFIFECKNEIGDTIEKKFIFEIMGKHSNFIVLGNDNMILDSLKHIGKNKSIRPVYGGIYYESIPTIKKNPFDISFEEFKENLKNVTKDDKVFKYLYKNYQGFSKDISLKIIYEINIDENMMLSDLNIEQVNLIYDKIQELKEKINDKNYYIYLKNGKCFNISKFKLSFLNDDEVSFEISNDSNNLVDRYFFEDKRENKYSNKVNNLKYFIKKDIEKLEHKIDNLNQDLEQANNLQTFKLYAELLTANLYKIQKGMKSIKVLNYYTNEEIEIPLSEKLKPNDNAQKYYKKYNKAKTTIKIATKSIENVKGDILYLENAMYSLDNIENDDDIDLIKEELATNGFEQKSNIIKVRKRNKQIFNPMIFKSSDGDIIKVGRNSRQNDELTLKKSNKDFVWLHIKDDAGSHVVIQNSLDKVSENTLFEAAVIAAYYSKGKNSQNVAIEYTKIKNVKKPKGAKPGMVIYDNNKTLFVTPDYSLILSLKYYENKEN